MKRYGVIVEKKENQFLACGKSLMDYMTAALTASGAEIVDFTQAESGVVLILTEALPFLTAATVDRMFTLAEAGIAVRLAQSGAFCFPVELISDMGDVKGTYKRLAREGRGVVEPVDEPETVAVTDTISLARAIKIAYGRKNLALMEQGVILIDPDATYIDSDVQVGAGTTVYPNNYLQGNTVIGENCVLYPGNRIENSVIADGVSIQCSVILKAEVGAGTTVGPYAYLRPNTVVGQKARIGDFVEIKNATIGNGSKCSHLSYVGDADVGENVNVGCGVVFVNYDGKNKFRSTVGDHAFVGSNSNLVAPVTIGDRAFIAAGSTVTEDVPEDALCIARSRQTVKDGWVKTKNK